MVLTYSMDPSKGPKDWVIKTDSGFDGDSLSYLDMMEKHSAEERRRIRERQIMEEGKALWLAKKSEELEMEQKEQEKIREQSRQRLFGRPGHGAPTEDIRKKKFTEYQLDEQNRRVTSKSTENLHLDPPTSFTRAKQFSTTHLATLHHDGGRGLMSADDDNTLDKSDVMTFGRPGCGAPVRTKSGRLRTVLVGNPEIRFQNNESVKKTIVNTIRYKTNNEEREQYKRELEEQIQQRKLMERQEKEKDLSVSKQLAREEASQWGRPGPGGSYWRDSAVTGQSFFDRMGWSASADPRKRNFEVKHSENEDMKKEIEEQRQRKNMEYQDIISNVGVELVPLLKEKVTGKPKKDPTTGYMMSHSLSSTDVTKTSDPKRFEVHTVKGSDNSEEKRKYFDALHSQVVQKESHLQQRRRHDQEEQKKHFESWETFWGRPGYGAPRAGKGPQKENLMKILYYPAQQTCPNSVELITLERLPVK